MFHAQELVPDFLRLARCGVDDLGEVSGRGRRVRLRVTLDRQGAEGRIEFVAQNRGLDVQTAQKPESEPIGRVVEQRGEQMLRGGFGVVAFLREARSP